MSISTNRRPIEKPFWSQTCNLADLRTEMRWEPVQFANFTRHARNTAALVGLDTEAGPDEQDACKWTTFVQKCLEKFPALGTEFEDAWPIDLYFSKYTVYRRYNNQSRNRISSENSNRTRVNQKENEAPLNSKRTVTGSQRKTHSFTGKQNTQQFNLTPSVKMELGNTQSISATDTSFPTTTATQSSSIIAAAICAAWEACVLCGFQPPIPPGQKATLNQFFLGREYLRPGFHAAGIVDDHHFKILLRLRAYQREEFMKSLVPARMNPYEMVVISDMLENYVDGRGTLRTDTRRAKQVQQPKISQPSKSMLSHFCTLQCDYTQIKEHMQIADDEEYFGLVRDVEDMIPRFLDISAEYQEPTKLQDFIKAIRNELPTLKRYNNLWPLQVYIERFLSARRMGLSGTLEPQIQHQCPLQRSYPSLKVPESLVALLSDYGMQELGPAFVFLGVRSEEQFAVVVESRRFKTELLVDANLQHLHLTDFQIMMMRYILGEV
ncbi:hypothetical protein C8R44DRAFT_879913 [Mycena epipterygia]|nr:hypothetical protein C8R44DRAFT_879913 [Mycena epipterygia]